MMRCPVAFLILVLAAATLMPLGGFYTAQAARNPFIASERDKESPPERSPSAGYPSFLQPVMQKSAMAQQAIKQQMVRLAKDIRQHPFGKSFWGFMLLSFIYGVIHALGPGHGKIYTCSYFLSRPGTFKRGLIFGNLTMVFHVFSGSVLILVGALVLKTSGSMTLENSGIILERISYTLLTGLGLFFAVRIIHQLRSGKAHVHGSCPDTGDMKSLVITALAVGIVPCPGAALILLFSLTLGVLIAGLAAMVCVAAGMAITSSLFAFLAISIQKSFLALVEGNHRLFNVIYAVVTLSGAVCITVLGCLLLLGSF